MFYVLLLGIAAFGGLIYVLFIMQNVPGMTEERLGELEPLPSDLGVWHVDVESDAAREAREQGLTREVRTFYEEQSGKLFRQARYRDTTNAIVRTEPDERLKRRRVRR